MSYGGIEIAHDLAPGAVMHIEIDERGLLRQTRRLTIQLCGELEYYNNIVKYIER